LFPRQPGSSEEKPRENRPERSGAYSSAAPSIVNSEEKRKTKTRQRRNYKLARAHFFGV
jgi:hypothetical protein